MPRKGCRFPKVLALRYVVVKPSSSSWWSVLDFQIVQVIMICSEVINFFHLPNGHVVSQILFSFWNLYLSLIFRCVHTVVKSSSELCFVCLCVCPFLHILLYLSSQWMNFCETLYWELVIVGSSWYLARFFLKLKKASHRSYRENQNTHLMRNIFPTPWKWFCLQLQRIQQSQTGHRSLNTVETRFSRVIVKGK